jgi:predicted NBD/HSP70 family sugar kinase
MENLGSHVGIEMGGTSCKIGIFTDDFQLIAKTVIQTSSTDAQFTLNEISTWIAD